MTKQNWTRAIAAWVALCMALLIGLNSIAVLAQNVTATPALIELPSPLPIVSPTSMLAAAPPTATVVAVVVLEALTEANVRASASLDGEVLGSIRAGDNYTVLGRYYRWIKFQYDKSPTQIGWVFDELVQIKGDQSLIVDLALAEATANAVVAAVTPTPFGEGAAAPVVQFPVETARALEAGATLEVLPTYTFPPDVVAQAPENAFQTGKIIEQTAVPLGSETQSNGDIPPLMPIVLLALGGIVGIFVSTRGR